MIVVDVGTLLLSHLLAGVGGGAFTLLMMYRAGRKKKQMG